ncbi:MAG: hypothetical protein GX201_13005 [Clostridiales bacterium]|nr:hypothetical protein [Clostridiales bacterium]
MYKSKKTTALLLSLIMMFSLVLSPLSAVYASEQPKLPKVEPSKDTKTPTTPPDINPLKAPLNTKPSTTPTLPNIPSITTPSISAVALEKAARVQGVNYEEKEGIKRVPEGVVYELRELTLDRFFTYDIDENVSIDDMDDEELLERINGIRVPPGAKILAVPHSYLEFFAPEKKEIYIDEELGNAFKILRYEGKDEHNNNLYSVEIPDLLEVFSSYEIPEQTVHLTTGNIAYIDPDFELSPESGMPKNYIAKANDSVLYEDSIVKVTADGNKHILTLKSNVMVFEYPFKDKGRNLDKKKLEKDEEEKEYYSDVKGEDNKTNLKVAVRVKEGSSVVVENPKLNVKMEINPLTSQLDAKFAFDCKATADITLLGELAFNHTLEKCVYGYDINLGKVAGKEKGNAAFVGIFLVLGVNGEINVEVRTMTTGDAEAGFAYKSIGWGSLPYYIGPYATFRPASFDMSFTVDGEIHATLACVPQVGVVIWGCELGVLQIWVGFKSSAEFHFQGGGGTDTEETFSGEGTIDLRAFGELVGYLIGRRYSIFYIELPIFKGEWKIGQEVSGSGGDGVRKVLPYFQVTADAYSNIVEGKVAFSTSGKVNTGYMGKDIGESAGFEKYSNGAVIVKVYDREGILKLEHVTGTDDNGKFSVNYGNLLATDWVEVEVPENESPVITLEDGKKFKVAGVSKRIRATVPFIEMDFNVDTLNDVITGWVSGDYTGPVTIKIWHMDNSIVTKVVNAQGGIFRLDYPIDRNTLHVTVDIPFEGRSFGTGELKGRNLDAIEIISKIEYEYWPEEHVDSIMERFGTNPAWQNAADVNKKFLGISEEEFFEGLERAVSIKSKKVVGRIINKGAMSWLEKQGANYVRPETDSGNTKWCDATVKITEIPIISEELLSAIQRYRQLHPQRTIPGVSSHVGGMEVYRATTRTTQEMGLRLKRDGSSPSGYAIETYPTSTAKFEFDPGCIAYRIEVEYEGLTVVHEYCPYETHVAELYEDEPSMSDIIGPLREAYRLRSQERIESVINPAQERLNPAQERLNPIQERLNLVEQQMNPVEQQLNPVEGLQNQQLDRQQQNR